MAPALRYRGIEAGHIFILGTRYSTAMGANYIDEKQQTRDELRAAIAVLLDAGVAAGTIRASTLPSDNGKLINLGVVTYRGIDTQALHIGRHAFG